MPKTKRLDNLALGRTVEFHPVMGAFHIAEGTIVARRMYRGVRYYDVRGRIICEAGDLAPLITWTICPEDIRAVRP